MSGAAAGPESSDLYARALEVTPGGVNSPVRAMRQVLERPLFAARGEGAMLYDADGRGFVDLLGSWGPLILGHRHPAVIQAIEEQMAQALTFGMSSRIEVEMAEAVVRTVPTVEQVRFVSSGTEATMSAIRLARAATGRDLIVKFAGCYHGHTDALLARAGSAAAESALPLSPGVPAAAAQDTRVLEYNDLAQVERLFADEGQDIACIIVEPIAANMGVVAPEPGFLEALRRITRSHGALLIFDEVITGYRVSLSGAQGALGIAPDLTCLGKVIGGGLPVGAYGGPRSIMQLVSPVGDVFQAGTLSGSPLAMAAGLAQVRTLEQEGDYPRLHKMGREIAARMEESAARSGVPCTVNSTHGLLTCFFTEGPVKSLKDTERSDKARFRAFWQGMLEEGVLLPPAQNEALFLSFALMEEHLGRILEAVPKAMRQAAEA